MKGGPLVVWPSYFDERLSRAEGRRVPKGSAVRDPTAEWVASAAKKAGLKPELDEKAKHPRVPYKAVGCVRIEGEGKEAMLRSIAEQLRSSR